MSVADALGGLLPLMLQVYLWSKLVASLWSFVRTHSVRQRCRGARCPLGSWLRGECVRLPAAAAARWAEAQLSGPWLLADGTSCFTLVGVLPADTHKGGYLCNFEHIWLPHAPNLLLMGELNPLYWYTLVMLRPMLTPTPSTCEVINDGVSLSFFRCICCERKGQPSDWRGVSVCVGYSGSPAC